MVIAVNTRLLIEDKLEGIGWFTFETMKRITQNHPQHQFIFIFDRPYSEKFIFGKNITPVVIGPPTRHPVLWYLWFEFRIPRILKKYKADLFLSPDGYLSLNTKTPQLAVIHDINFVHRPKDLPWLKAKYYNHFFPKFARKATRIATVSNYSKKDIIDSFTIDAAKIDVVYNGINTAYTPTLPDNQKYTREKYTSCREYFLFVGALHPRKNITGLLKAFDTFKIQDEKGIKLLIVGGQMHKTGKISETYKNMQFKNDVVFTGRVPTSELHSILGAALALTFVPFFEGFGIPVVEAMSAGVPVICSNTTSLPEVGDNAVIYVDPNQTGQISDAMSLLANTPEKRRELIQKGFQQKEKFSWGKTAKLLWKSIEKTIPGEY